MLLASLFACVGVMKAGVTDLPQMSEGENIKWYTISNTRSTSGKYLYWTANGVKDSNERTAASFFYLTGTTEACYIHNYATGLLFSGNGAWTESGVACKLTASPLGTGLMIGFNSTFLNENNYDSGFTTWGDVNDDGSVFVFEEVTDFSAIINIDALKDAAIAELNNYAVETTIYPAVKEAVDAVNAVTPVSNGLKDLNDAAEAIEAIVVDYRNAAYQALDGKYFTIKTPARGNGFMQMSTSNVVGTAAAESPANIWQFVCNDNGTVNVYNPYTGKYLSEPGNSSANVGVTTEQANAGAYVLNINATNPAVSDAKVKFTSNGKSVHMAGGFNLVRWDNGGASEWQVVQITDFSNIIDLYKAAALASMEEWETLSVVFDAELIKTAKTALNDINTTDWATFAAVDAELTKVTDAVAAKMFTFQTIADDNHREGVWVSANPSTGKAIGLHGEHNYNSIWSLRHAGGVAFYLYNELNSVYMGAPSDNCPLTETPAVAYTFEMIDAANGVVEMHTNGETLHASNHDDDKLLNWDGNEAASRWTISTIDVAADIQALLDGLTEEDYDDVPALGQYPTAAYEALVEARTSAKTVEEVEAAIATFKAAKNLPVFTIDGVISYAAGKSVYDDQNGAPNFKATNVYDKTMWWVFDQTTVTVGETENVNVINYATRNGFWGAEALKIAETEENIAEDGIFLFYTVGNNTPLHYQNDNQVIVRWSSTAATSGSATRFTHIGNTYDLDKLTDAHVTTLSALQAAYDAKAFYADAVLGEGLGQYKGTAEDKAAIEATLAPAEAILNGTLSEQANTTVDAINSAAAAINEVAGLEINLPEAGKYYRFQGACDNAEYSNYYITGHTNADGGRIALTSEADASTIYYFDGTNLIAYQSGLVVGLSSGNWTFASIDDDSKPASTIVFAGSPRKAGKYTIKSADRYFHYFYYSENNTVQVNRCQNDVCKEHDWALTEVTTLPVTISAAGYSTFYAPVNVELPAELTANTLADMDTYAKLVKEDITVIPAENGVILAGTAGETYNLTVTDAEAADLANALEGTVAKTLVSKTENDAYYMLVVKEGVAGLYNPVKGDDNTKFYNGGHKAYWHIAGAVQSASYRIGEDEDATAIDQLINANGEVVIYDLSGRRVEKMEKGIYIVNGKKVVK